MNQEKRTVRFDSELQLEAYHLEGILQRFPPHFHDYYVIGYIENGRRRLTCNEQVIDLDAGDLILFNPQDLHTCEPIDGYPLDYRSLNVGAETIRRAVKEISGKDALPRFAGPVLRHSELTDSLREIHQLIMQGESGFGKEEIFYFLLAQLLSDYTQSAGEPKEIRPEIRAACSYLEQNYAQPVTLDELSGLAGLSKYHFLRSFTRQKGISPYRYLETIRVGRAKELLEQGISPADTAQQTGFSDQSHFTNFFKKYIGLTPRQYADIFAGEQANREDL